MTKKVINALRGVRAEEWDSYREYESARWAEEHDGCPVDWGLLNEVSKRLDDYKAELMRQKAHQKMFAQWAAHRLMEMTATSLSGRVRAAARLYKVYTEWEDKEFPRLLGKCEEIIKGIRDYWLLSQNELGELERVCRFWGYDVYLGGDRSDYDALEGGLVPLRKGRRY